MKANHIPREERIQNRIWKLRFKLGDPWMRTRKRFYPFCKGCDRTNIEVSMYGHYKGCEVKGLENEIKYYEGLIRGLAESG